jgi:hypothetical protein
MTIFDMTPRRVKGELIPDSIHAWITIRYLEPAPANDMHIERIDRTDKRFDGYFGKYQSVWGSRKKLN